MKWDVDAQKWVSLDDVLIDQNRKSREFHSFAEDEFGEHGYLADAWGGEIRILVDYDGDGLIELSTQVVDEIKAALKSDYDAEQIEEAEEKFRVIRDKVAIYVLEDANGETDSQNVFSWDIKSFYRLNYTFTVR